MNQKSLAASLAILALAGGLTSCATRPDLPIAKTICLDAQQETPTEVAYVRRKAAEFIGERGFQIVDKDCEVSVQYDRFGAFQGETATSRVFWISRNGYWSQEGIVTVTAGGKTLEQDMQVALRGYSTKQDLLNDLAWQIIRPVTWHFQSAPTTKKQ